MNAGKRRRLRGTVWIALALAAGIFVGAGGMAVARHDETKTARTISAWDIVEKLDGKETKATVVEVTLKPGQEGEPHRHPGPVIGYVLEGEYELGIDEQPSKVFKAGQTFYEPTGCLHRVLASSQWFCIRGTPSRSRFRNRISNFALGGGVGAMLKPFHLRWIAVWLLRVALAFSFLSAVADRFGLWGQFGSGVAWGDFERFTAYTAQLLWFLPPSLASPAAILATAAEVVVAGGLLVGWRLHWWAFAAAALLLSFALAMTGALGVKAPIDYSVWTAAAAAFLLGVVAPREHMAAAASAPQRT